MIDLNDKHTGQNRFRLSPDGPVHNAKRRAVKPGALLVEWKRTQTCVSSAFISAVSPSR